MRVLSPASDAPLHKTTNTDSTINETEITNTRTPSIAMTPTVPTVVLDIDVVSHNMAARLCLSFLSHVLFLKNQVPFPIVQLARMSMSDNMTRAAKKRQELLNSFDTLASHLYTTFVALSTALALRGSRKAELGSETNISTQPKDGVAQAFFVVALGSTVGTAKTRVMVGIDGLETKVWGLREDDISHKYTRKRDEDDSDDAVENVSETDGQDQDDQDQPKESRSSSEEEAGSEPGDNASPPPSRSPSPALSSDSVSTSPSVMPNFSLVPADDTEVVRAAERLVSRTLASVCAEDDGRGLASEMAPTQIHVLLRAPRRFDHPSWIPRQNLCNSLDNYRADFLVGSGQMPALSDTTARKRSKAYKVQGVWIKARGSTHIQDPEEDIAEEDELIWWSWNGKLAGFSDW